MDCIYSIQIESEEGIFRDNVTEIPTETSNYHSTTMYARSYHEAMTWITWDGGMVEKVSGYTDPRGDNHERWCGLWKNPVMWTDWKTGINTWKRRRTMYTLNPCHTVEIRQPTQGLEIGE